MIRRSKSCKVRWEKHKGQSTQLVQRTNSRTKFNRSPRTRKKAHGVVWADGREVHVQRWAAAISCRALSGKAWFISPGG